MIKLHSVFLILLWVFYSSADPPCPSMFSRDNVSSSKEKVEKKDKKKKLKKLNKKILDPSKWIDVSEMLPKEWQEMVMQKGWMSWGDYKTEKREQFKNQP